MLKIKFLVTRFILLLFFLSSFNSNGQVESPVKISGESSLFGGVSDLYEISSDGNWVVYIADKDAVGIFELYSVSIDDGTIFKLNDTLVAGGDVTSFEISPDSQSVVYIADQESSNEFGLYRVPIEGGPTVRIDDDNSGEDVSAVRISASGQKIVFRQRFDLFSVPFDGGEITQLTNTANSGGIVQSNFILSADEQWVVFTLNDFSTTEVFSVPIDGGDSNLLNMPLEDRRLVISFLVSPDSQHVVYIADQSRAGIFELYSAPISGDVSPIRLNLPYSFLLDSGRVLFFDISDDSQNVVYIADQNSERVFELFSVPIAGGQVIQLNDLLANNSSVTFNINISGDSVIYRADLALDMANVNQLYSVPIRGGTSVALDLPRNCCLDFQSTPDNERVIYIDDANEFSVNEIFSYSFETSNSTKLNTQLPTNGDVFDFQVSPDGSFLVYRADQSVDNIFGLYFHALTENGLMVPESNELCFPIKTENSTFTTICL